MHEWTSARLEALSGWTFSFHPGHDSESLFAPFWRWTLDPLVIGSLLISACAYGWGTRRLWRHAGRFEGVRPWQLACFVAGWLSIVLSLLSPLDAFSDVSFAAHMTQHELLMLVAAPLLILGRPLVAMVWALPRVWRAGVGRVLGQRAWRRSWRVLSDPLVALTLHAVAIWLWHIPRLFEAALEHEPLHAVQHLSFFLSAALFWWALIHGRYGRVGYGLSVLFVFATALHTSVLGALLSLGQTLWYPESAGRSRVLGIEPLDDQQLAGLLMWVPSGVIFALLGLALFSAWLGDSERRATRRAQRAVKTSPRTSEALP
jgi:cytochrome c oxidase assembly factor CtaG